MAKKDKYGYKESLPRFFKADVELQKKVGTGSLDNGSVGKAQAYLDSIKTDIAPQLRESLMLMETALANAREVNYGREEFLPDVTKPLMDIKSVSGMFHEMMICRVSSFVLTFVEDVRKFDADVTQILMAYVKVVKTLLDLGIKDETNPHGQNFINEIRAATKRYYDKQAAAKGG